MDYRFKKHYTRDEARALLPKVRQWLQTLSELRKWVGLREEELSASLTEGRDLGGEKVDGWLKGLCRIRKIVGEFERREIQLKDIDRGLIDFPAVIAGKEVFLCWEQDDEDIEFWHDLESGYAGRERLK